MRVTWVGYSETASGGWEAVLWSPNGTATVLQDLGGSRSQSGECDQRFGRDRWVLWTRNTGYFAVEWSPNGTATALGGGGWANGINSDGDIVGTGPGGWIVWSHDGTTTVLQGAAGLSPGDG